MTEKDDEISVHIDSTEIHEGVHSEGVGLPKCPDCGANTESGYGLAFGGLGPYTYCSKCSWVAKVQDHEC